MIKTKVGFLAVLFATAVTARASELWQWTHDAHGMGTSNLMDGGPPVMRSGQTEGPDDGWMTFIAADDTMPGSLGATTLASGRSNIETFLNFDGTYVLSIFVDLRVGYFPSSFPGGDNPGGSAEGEIHSIMEFVVPKDDAVLSYDYLIDNTHPQIFDGLSSVLMENLTQSTVILDLTEETDSDGYIPFNAAAGDVIRLTVDAEGSGGMGSGTGRDYGMDLFMTLSVPEPGALVLLTLGLILVTKPRNIPTLDHPVRSTS